MCSSGADLTWLSLDDLAISLFYYLFSLFSLLKDLYPLLCYLCDCLDIRGEF